jgi:hypothetical protein
MHHVNIDLIECPHKQDTGTRRIGVRGEKAGGLMQYAEEEGRPG